MTDSSEIDRLIAQHDIERVLYEYAYLLDMNRPDELVELFTDECEVVYGPGFAASGRQAYRETLDGIGTYFTATSHHVSNVVVDFDSPDAATVRSTIYAWHSYTRERPDGHFFGQYHDRVVRGDAGRWRIARRELRASGVIDMHTKDHIPIGRS